VRLLAVGDIATVYVKSFMLAMGFDIRYYVAKLLPHPYEKTSEQATAILLTETP